MSSATAQQQPRDPGTGATEHVVAALTRAIREDNYHPGDRLVESRLTEQFGVSRSSVREALRRLEAFGLVEIELHVVSITLEGIVDQFEIVHVQDTII